MIARIPLFLQPVLANGQALPFSSNTFDVILCITSLEFMKHPDETIKQIVNILKPKGILLALMLNLDSTYVKQKMHNPTSYIGKHLKQQNLESITDVVSLSFRKIIPEIDLKREINENEGELLSIMHRLKILKALK